MKHKNNPEEFLEIFHKLPLSQMVLVFLTVMLSKRTNKEYTRDHYMAYLDDDYVLATIVGPNVMNQIKLQLTPHLESQLETTAIKFSDNINLQELYYIIQSHLATNDLVDNTLNLAVSLVCLNPVVLAAKLLASSAVDLVSNVSTEMTKILAAREFCYNPRLTRITRLRRTQELKIIESEDGSTSAEAVQEESSTTQIVAQSRSERLFPLISLPSSSQFSRNFKNLFKKT